MAEAQDDAQWEVVCIACGDDEGPLDDQSAGVKTLRGPYPTAHKARHAARKHEREENPRGWIPGSAVPLPEGL